LALEDGVIVVAEMNISELFRTNNTLNEEVATHDCHQGYSEMAARNGGFETPPYRTVEISVHSLRAQSRSDRTHLIHHCSSCQH